MKFDGINIDAVRGRFSGNFDMDDRLVYGDEVVIVMTARLKSAVMDETSSGDVRRVNVLKPLELTFIFDDDDQLELRREYGFTLPQPQLFAAAENVLAIDEARVAGPAENETAVESSDPDAHQTAPEGPKVAPRSEDNGYSPTSPRDLEPQGEVVDQVKSGDPALARFLAELPS